MTPDVKEQGAMNPGTDNSRYHQRLSQSLRGLPSGNTTRCSCVLISASTKQHPARGRPRKMRKSILSFAKRLWSSEEPAHNRKTLCSNCKSDPVTRNTLCKKCCRRSTVCGNCYSKILSLHHTRLERYGSLTDKSSKCSECDLISDNSISYITPNNVIRSKEAIKKSVSYDPSLTRPRTNNTISLQNQKSYSSSDSEYQSCSENIDPESPDQRSAAPIRTLNKDRSITLNKDQDESHENSIIIAKISDNSKTVSNCKVVRTRYDIDKSLRGDAGQGLRGDGGQGVKGDGGHALKGDAGHALKGDAGQALKVDGGQGVTGLSRYRLHSGNRPVMTRWKAIEEDDTVMDKVMVKRTSMDGNGCIKPDVILPDSVLNKENNTHTDNTHTDNTHTDNTQIPVEFTTRSTRSYSESTAYKKGTVNLPSADTRHGRAGERRSSSVSTHVSRGPSNASSHCHVTGVKAACHVSDHVITDNELSDTRAAVKRTVRIAEEENLAYSRPCSLEVEHVTVGEVTPTVYIPDKNDIIDESIQKSESVLKRSLSVSNSRLQRKLSKRLGPQKDRNVSQSEDIPFLRRNRSSSSVDKSSPPPDLLMFTQSGMKIEDIQTLGSIYLKRLETQMRNVDSLKEIEKQQNISCRERLKMALDAHEQLSADLETLKKQLKDCMESYRYISETFV